jgi:hypothetical protein
MKYKGKYFQDKKRSGMVYSILRHFSPLFVFVALTEDDFEICYVICLLCVIKFTKKQTDTITVHLKNRTLTD